MRRPKTWEELKEQYGGLDIQLAENCVEYALFLLTEYPNGGGARKHLATLETIRKAALELSAKLTKDFIWQREEFTLSIKHDAGMFILPLDDISKNSSQNHYQLIRKDRSNISTRCFRLRRFC